MVEPTTPMPTPNEDKYSQVIGLFEGGGYQQKGIFRPTLDCKMKSLTAEEFCPICKKSILEVTQNLTE